MVPEQLQRLVIGRCFDQNDVARLGEKGADVIERLGRAATEHDMFSLYLQILFPRQPAPQVVDQGPVALFWSILQRQFRPCAEHIVCRTAEPVRGECSGIR